MTDSGNVDEDAVLSALTSPDILTLLIGLLGLRLFAAKAPVCRAWSDAVVGVDENDKGWPGTAAHQPRMATLGALVI